MSLLLITAFDDPDHWRRRMDEIAPEIEFHVWPDVGDPSAVEMAVLDTLSDDPLAGLPHLKCVTFLGHGVSSILGDPRVPAGVTVTRLTDAGIMRCMTELVLFFVLQHHWHGAEYRRSQADSEWKRLAFPDAAATTIGVLGLGSIGSRVASMFSRLEFRVRGWARGPHDIDGVECVHGRDALHEFVSDLDYVVCVLPETDETRDIINATTLSAMRPGAYLVNVGRGALVDEEALLDALDRGQLAGAALDVFKTEPLPAGHPFWRHPKIVITPHAGGGSTVGAVDDVAANYRRLRAGEPLLNTADRERGY